MIMVGGSMGGSITGDEPFSVSSHREGLTRANHPKKSRRVKLHCFHESGLLGWKKNLLKALEGIWQRRAGRVSTQNATIFPTNATYLFLDPPTEIANQTQTRKFLVLIGDLQNLASFLDSSLSQKAKKNHRHHTLIHPSTCVCVCVSP